MLTLSTISKLRSPSSGDSMISARTRPSFNKQCRKVMGLSWVNIIGLATFSNDRALPTRMARARVFVCILSPPPPQSHGARGKCSIKRNHPPSAVKRTAVHPPIYLTSSCHLNALILYFHDVSPYLPKRPKEKGLFDGMKVTMEFKSIWCRNV